MPHLSQRRLFAQISSERSLSDFAQTAYLESKHVKMALVRLIVAQIKKAIL
jgi:hypothetical protein